MNSEYVLQELLQRNKFEFGFMGLILGTLALTFQFSTKMGKGYICILTLAWIFIIISASIGAYRLFKIIGFSNLNNLQLYDYLMSDESKDNFNDSHFNKLKNQRDLLDKSLQFKFKLQFLFYFSGIILNGIFAILIFRIKIFKKEYLLMNDIIITTIILILVLIFALVICIRNSKA